MKTDAVKIKISWLARLALNELAERRGQTEEDVLEELIRDAAISELGKKAKHD